MRPAAMRSLSLSLRCDARCQCDAPASSGPGRPAQHHGRHGGLRLGREWRASPPAGRGSASEGASGPPVTPLRSRVRWLLAGCPVGAHLPLARAASVSTSRLPLRLVTECGPPNLNPSRGLGHCQWEAPSDAGVPAPPAAFTVALTGLRCLILRLPYFGREPWLRSCHCGSGSHLRFESECRSTYIATSSSRTT